MSQYNVAEMSQKAISNLIRRDTAKLNKIVDSLSGQELREPFTEAQRKLLADWDRIQFRIRILQSGRGWI